MSMMSGCVMRGEVLILTLDDLTSAPASSELELAGLGKEHRAQFFVAGG